ncbi:MAG TPA: GNAT family N-acetyltransferase [Candidatus Binataceae bacterium]|jgi:L-amino acid N-acyltransferase YncA
METSSDIHARYPKELQSSDGRRFTIRLMEPDDFDKSAVLKFAKSLSEDDLLYLRTDITDPAVVAQWVDNLRSGHTTSVLAEVKNELVGYASVHRDPARWTRDVGELRVNASPQFRGVGVGRTLVAEAFSLGQALGLRKLCGMLTPDQTGARTAFERLGFRVEALLQGWVRDRRGYTRDILVMTYDLDGFTDQV